MFKGEISNYLEYFRSSNRVVYFLQVKSYSFLESDVISINIEKNEINSFFETTKKAGRALNL